MPIDQTRGKFSKDGKQEKFERIYNSGEGDLVIWYKQGKKPDEKGFGRVLEGVRRARALLARSIQVLKNEPKGELATVVLRHHFGANDGPLSSEDLASIIESFELIQEGLRAQPTICLSKKLSDNTRGETNGADTDFHVHINLNILDDHPDALARTIIHEASHRFASTDGSVTSKRYGESDEDEKPEIYEYHSAYADKTTDEATMNADSYAWGALSLGSGRLLTSNTFRNDLGTTYLNE